VRDGSTEFPAIEELINSADRGPYEQKIIEDWQTLSAELRVVAPHVAQLIVEGMGGITYWQKMTAAERNIMSYTAVALLAEAKKRAFKTTGASKKVDKAGC
jgi:hypothetical protein